MCTNQKSNLTLEQASMARVEEAATEFFAKPPKERDTLEYVSSGKSHVSFFTRVNALPTKDTEVMWNTQEEILAECSHNVNLLFNLLDNVNKGESFVKQKKSRDIRCKDIFLSVNELTSLSTKLWACQEQDQGGQCPKDCGISWVIDDVDVDFQRS